MLGEGFGVGDIFKDDIVFLQSGHGCSHHFSRSLDTSWKEEIAFLKMFFTILMKLSFQPEKRSDVRTPCALKKDPVISIYLTTDRRAKCPNSTHSKFQYECYPTVLKKNETFDLINDATIFKFVVRKPGHKTQTYRDFWDNADSTWKNYGKMGIMPGNNAGSKLNFSVFEENIRWQGLQKERDYFPAEKTKRLINQRNIRQLFQNIKKELKIWVEIRLIEYSRVVK